MTHPEGVLFVAVRVTGGVNLRYLPRAVNEWVSLEMFNIR